MGNILYFFHHIHHQDGQHSVHHCGGDHKLIDPRLNYTISHCICQKHAIDKPQALGHATDSQGQPQEVLIAFSEKCPSGGWHVESGTIIS